MKKNKKYLLLVFLVVFVFLSAGYAHALEITSYPNIPGLKSPQSCAGSDCLPTYIAYWFGLLVYIAGVLAVISFVVGAVQLISPSVEVHKSATDRMKGAVLGLVLTVSAFIILQTINPTFITPTLTPLPGVPGIFYYNGTEKKPVSMLVDDTASRPIGFNSVLYDCTGKGEGSGGTGPALLIWEFPKAFLQANDNDYGGIKVKRVTCGGVESIASLGSFNMDYESSGVYYCFGGCNGDMCSGMMTGVNTASQDNIGQDRGAGRIGGVRIVGNYGVIFHNATGLANGGFCNSPIVNTDDGGRCLNVEKPKYTSAVDIFRLNQESGVSGDGVTFYSEPHGWDAGQEAGYLEVHDDEITFPYGDTLESKKACFDYTNVNQPDSYKYKCSESNCHPEWSEESGTGCSSTARETFQDSPGSIRIKGHYLVALYSKKGSGNECQTTDPNQSGYCAGGGTCVNNICTYAGNDEDLSSRSKGELYCLTFTKNAENLDAKSFLEPGATKRDLLDIYIIPTK